MSIDHEADAIKSRAAEVAEWLHSVIDIPPLGTITPHDEESTHRKHFRIPHILGESISEEDYHKYYEPHVVSIGPIHHGKPHVATMEIFKRKAVRELAERVKDDVPIEQVYASVEQHLLEARRCYSESNWNRFSDSEWGLMMFLDGCFIIGFISKEITTTGERSRLNIKKHDIELVNRDLLLLENQLPFQVLYLLARAFKCQRLILDLNLDLIIMAFVQMRLLPIRSHTGLQYFFKVFSRFQNQQPEARAPTHLLQYYRDIWISVLILDRVEEEEEEDNNKDEQAEEEDHLLVCSPFSVTELKKIGIRCSCASDSSIEIQFKSSILSGKLFLPRLTIEEWTMTLFYNLVAYEYSCNLQHRSFGISSYLSFMNMLIDGEEDVKELRSRGVIQLNLKVGDDQVVNFFKDITAHDEPNSQGLRHVKNQISTYSKSKRLPLKVAYAELKQRYFSSPWSILVFLAVIFTFSTTVIQTVFTGIQTYKKD